MKENKFVMGEEEETPTKQNKKPTRHHVKRRSSGKVHVTKLAPLARVNSAHTDSEATDVDNNTNDRPFMRRSQSQRSLHRISLERKGFTPLTRRKSNSTDTIPFVISTNNSSSSSTSNPASISSQVIAAPIEQPLHTLANTLVIPKQTLLNKPINVKKQLLLSKFINNNEVMSRTQQKLLLQKQQSQVQDETSPIHPRNMQKINKELDVLNKETKCIKRYQDPMKESLLRCLSRKNKRSLSTFVVPTLQQQQQQPHFEQRQIAHRHYRLKTIALQQQQQRENMSCSKSSHSHPTMNTTISNNNSTIWNFFDKVFHS